MSKSRLETFSDGVFAIAITLLVLTIAQPSHYRQLTHQLEQKWPSLAAYVVSFVVIGIMWLNHHTIFQLLERVDRKLFYLNLLLLMTIAFLPYPTGVLGQALGQGEGATAAAAFYSITMVVNSCCWAGLWLHASSRRRLLIRDFPEDQRAKMAVLFTAGGGVYAIAIGIAFISPYACLAFNAALAAYYALDPLSWSIAPSRAAESDPDEGKPGGS